LPHVVLNKANNGTRYAFRPDSSRATPKKCVTSQTCRICFGEADSSCMNALYRGGGPKVGAFGRQTLSARVTGFDLDG
jgi:hypothetical protein